MDRAVAIQTCEMSLPHPPPPPPPPPPPLTLSLPRPISHEISFSLSRYMKMSDGSQIKIFSGQLITFKDRSRVNAQRLIQDFVSGE